MRLIGSVQLNHQGVLSKRKGLYVIDGQKRLVTQENYVPEGRAIHLIDIENLMGGPRKGRERLRWVVYDYRVVACVDEVDHPIIGVNPELGHMAYDSWRSARLVTRGGPDGADKALLDTVKDHGFILRRYYRLVIGSGDHAFADTAKMFVGYGLRVDVVSRRTALSKALQDAASSVRIMPDYDEPDELAA